MNSEPPGDELIKPDQIGEVVRLCIRIVSPHPLGEIIPENRLISDLGFHSLALAELAFTLEELFSLDPVTPEAAMEVERVCDIENLISTAMADGLAQLPAVAEVRAVAEGFGGNFVL